MNYNASSGAGVIVAAEFKGDSKLAPMVANCTSGNVSVLLGNGDGTFAAAANYVAGANPDGVAVGYFNANNHLDVVVANQGDDSVIVAAGQRQRHIPDCGELRRGLRPGIGSRCRLQW